MKRFFTFPVYVSFFVFILMVGFLFGRPLYSSLPLAAVITAGVAKMAHRESYVRGQKLMKFQFEALPLAKKFLPASDPGIFIGGLPLRSEAKYSGILIIGRMGTGKSAVISHIQEQFFRGMREGKPVRGLVYDPKNKAPKFLSSLGVPFDRMRILNPKDRRAVGWDVQRDSSSPEIARGIAYAFIPDKPEQRDDFWTKAPRELLAGVMVSFTCSDIERVKENIQRQKEGRELLPPFRWTLHHVAETLSNLDDLREVLSRHPDSESAIRFLDKDKDKGDIISSLEADFAHLRMFASRWADCDLISFTDWRDEEEGKVLIFGSDRDIPEINHLNRMMIYRITQLATHEVEKKRDMLFSLDEFTQLGRIPEFSKFSTLVREYGGCVCIATQNTEQMKMDYGEREMNIIIDDLATKIFLGCGMNSAVVASQAISKQELYEEGDSQQYGQRGVTIGTNRNKKTSDAVMVAELMQLPNLDEKGELSGFYLSSFLNNRVWFKTLTKEKELATIWGKEGTVLGYDRIGTVTIEDREAFRRKSLTPQQREDIGLPPRKNANEDVNNSQKDKPTASQKKKKKARTREPYRSPLDELGLSWK